MAGLEDPAKQTHSVLFLHLVTYWNTDTCACQKLHEVNIMAGLHYFLKSEKQLIKEVLSLGNKSQMCKNLAALTHWRTKGPLTIPNAKQASVSYSTLKWKGSRILQGHAGKDSIGLLKEMKKCTVLGFSQP